MAEQSGQQQDGVDGSGDAAQAQQADRGKHLRHSDANVDEAINRKRAKRWKWQEAKVTEAAKLEEMGVTQKVKYGRDRLQEELAELAREGFGKYSVVLVGDERSHEACSALVGRVFSIDGAGWSNPAAATSRLPLPDGAAVDDLGARARPGKP